MQRYLSHSKREYGITSGQEAKFYNSISLLPTNHKAAILEAQLLKETVLRDAI